MLCNSHGDLLLRRQVLITSEFVSIINLAMLNELQTTGGGFFCQLYRLQIEVGGHITPSIGKSCPFKNDGVSHAMLKIVAKLQEYPIWYHVVSRRLTRTLALPTMMRVVRLCLWCCADMGSLSTSTTEERMERDGPDGEVIDMYLETYVKLLQCATEIVSTLHISMKEYLIDSLMVSSDCFDFILTWNNKNQSSLSFHAMGHLRSLMDHGAINTTSVSPSMMPRYLYTSLSYLLLDCPFLGVRQHIAEKIKTIFVEDALMYADDMVCMKTKLKECVYTILASKRTHTSRRISCRDHFKLLGELVRIDQPQRPSHFPFALTFRDYLVRDILRIEWPDQEPVMVPSSTSDASNQTRNTIRRVGLMDCDETSYMNSVLQQLFGIPEIRFAVICSVECVQDVLELDDEDWKTYSVIQELRRVFRCLHNGYTEMYDPIRLVNACVDLQTDELGTTRNDASNFYSKIVTVLIEYLNVNTTRTYMDQISCINVFLSKLKTCTKCNRQTTSCCPVLFKLSVKVVKKETGEPCRSIEDCLDDFIKPVRMQGDNGIYCKSCEESTEATVATVCELLVLPKVTLWEETNCFCFVFEPTMVSNEL